MALNRKQFALLLYVFAGVVVISALANAAKAFKCDYCGNGITGHYIESNDKNYHKKCYEDHVALRCALCGEIINGEYYQDFWGNTIHAEHKGEVPQCEYCRRFISEKISGGGVQYDDGRIVCGLCYKNAITDPVMAESIKSAILNDLKQRGIGIDATDVPLYLVNKNAMTELAGDRHTDPLGFVLYEKSTYSDGTIVEQSFSIYMLNGLPRFDFTGALAHELMHVWLFSNVPTDIDPAFREGSCNYAAYLALQKYSDKEARFVIDRMLNDPDPIYGDGFRRVKEFVEEKGVRYWLQYLKNQKHLSR